MTDRLAILDRLGDPGLRALARQAARVAGSSSGAVHVFDGEHQHRLAAVDVPLVPHPRQDSMCRLVVDGAERIVCDDACADPRFAYSSFVQGAEPIRFYASFPVFAGDGAAAGTLCVWDTRRLDVSPARIAELEALAERVADRLELRYAALRALS